MSYMHHDFFSVGFQLAIEAKYGARQGATAAQHNAMHTPPVSFVACAMCISANEESCVV